MRQGFESDQISSRQVLCDLLCGHLYVWHTLAKAELADF